jgi:DNA polymerase III subunit beta
MEFRIAKDELIRALARVQGIVEKRSTNPIIANVLLEVDEQGMRVAATDTEVSFVGRYKVECTRPGRLTLGARQLYEIARLVPTDEVSFCLPEGQMLMEIKSGRSFFKVLGLAADDFPEVPDPDEVEGFSIEFEALKELIDKILFSISSDDTRTGLNGAHVESREVDGKLMLRFVATDGHRLSLCGRPYQGEYKAPRTVLLPKKGLAELRKLVDDGEGSWSVLFGESQATFRRGSIAFSMRLLEGDFPDYEQVVPSGWQRRILVRRDALSQALRRVSILASEKSHPVRFMISGGTVTVVARQPEAGEATEELEAQVEGSDLEIGFNAGYFREALSALSTDTVTVEIGDSLSPCLVRPGEGDDDELFVIMPMRLE